MKRYDIINALIKKNRYRSYLELGTENKRENFDKIKCEKKFCVDINPLTEADFIGSTDEFFKQNQEQYSIIFVDADHDHKQAFTDIINSIVVVSSTGTIVCHDCNPEKEIIQRVPRETMEWTGNVWKAIVKLKQLCPIRIQTVDTDYGCAIIDFQTGDTISVTEDLTYANLEKNRKEWLGLISVEQFKEMYL